MERSNKLLIREFIKYLIPTMVTTAAVSLNEFADSMLVSNLLGSDALALVNLGTPVMLVMAAVSLLLGSGGSTAYALAAGRRDHEAAGKSFTCSTAIALVLGLTLLFCSRIAGPIAGLLCRDPVLVIPFEKYLSVLFLSAPFVVALVAAVSFLPAAGHPKYAMAVNIAANVINIIMDYVYIRIFHMGIEGAAWATLTGYVCAAALMVCAVAMHRVELYYNRNIVRSLQLLGDVFRFGVSDALNQIGLSFQLAFINGLALAAAGSAGVVAYSLCMQVNSVMSVLIGAVIGSAVPVMAVLHGQRDYRGEAGMLKIAMICSLAASAAGTVLFLLFAPAAASLYNITEPLAFALSVAAVRVYALSLLPRNAVVVYYRYLKVIGLTVYASIISALDSFGLIIPAAWILVKCVGIHGLWWAYPVAAVLLLMLILACNRRYAARSGGRLQGPLLIECDEETEPVLDVSISAKPEEIAAAGRRLQEICLEAGMKERDAARASLAAEEIAVNAAARKGQSSYADMIVRISHGKVEIDFRTLGRKYDPLAEEDERLRENLLILTNIASAIEHEYIMGMNCTRITLEGEKEDTAAAGKEP